MIFRSGLLRVYPGFPVFDVLYCSCRPRSSPEEEDAHLHNMVCLAADFEVYACMCHESPIFLIRMHRAHQDLPRVIFFFAENIHSLI